MKSQSMTVIDSSPEGQANRLLTVLKGSVKTELVVLTPDLASELLQNNDKNRKLKEHHVGRLAAAQRKGQWQFNGESICVADNGRLLDGQHRCAMVIETGIPIIVVMVTGMPEKVFTTYDIGIKRSAADVLGILGQTNTLFLASALSWIEKYRNERMIGNEGVPTTVVEDLLTEHAGIAESLKLVVAKRHKLSVHTGLMIALHYLFSMVDKEQADRFIEDLETGIGLRRDDGVYQLRERLIKNDSAKAKLGRPDVAALCIKAWNFRRRGASCRILVWKSTGDAAEAFPQIDGLTFKAAKVGST